MKAHPDPAVQLLLDRSAVRDVILHYARAVDRRDFASLARCFTPDVEGQFGGEWRGGRDALVEYISGVAAFHTTMHMMGNSFVEISGDEASLQSYAMLTHHGTREDGEEWQYNNSTARYSERLVRERDGWRIRERGAPTAWAPTGATGVETADPAVRWLLDRAQIHDVAMQYALGIDLREYERVRGCFSRELIARYGDTELRDAEALVAFVRGVEAFESTTHFLGTPLIEVDGDAARVETLAYITHRQAREGRRPKEWMAGGSRYRDRWVREAGRWRIAERALGAGTAEVGVAPLPVPRSDDPEVRGLLDRAEISDLVGRTALALDRGDFEGLAGSFSDAGRGFADDQGHELAGWARTSHLLGNQTLTLEGDRARAETYVYRTLHATEDEPASAWSDGALRWADQLVREPEGWRVAQRTVASNRVS